MALCREAAVNAMRSKESLVSNSDFEKSLQFVKPSITKDVEEWRRINEEESYIRYSEAYGQGFTMFLTIPIYEGVAVSLKV